MRRAGTWLTLRDLAAEAAVSANPQVITLALAVLRMAPRTIRQMQRQLPLQAGIPANPRATLGHVLFSRPAWAYDTGLTT